LGPDGGPNAGMATAVHCPRDFEEGFGTLLTTVGVMVGGTGFL